MASEAGAGAIKYRAFLSYAHADKSVAERLHRTLERFRLDADLARGAKPPGALKLAPIFIDRGSFVGGHELLDATKAALDASAALIVLCTPLAPSRPAVQEEVRLFKHRHPDRPIIPVIAGGATPDCYPPALRFALDADGTVGTTPITVLGVDIGEKADGWSLGVAKVVAGLLGLADANDIYRREERRKRRDFRLRSAIAAVLIAALAGASYFGWQSQHKQTLINLQVASMDASTAANAGRYDDAMRLQADYARSIREQEVSVKGKPGDLAAGTLGTLSWYALFARKPDVALKATEDAGAIIPGILWIEMNRAHALELLGRKDEAKAIYTAHRGVRVRLPNGAEGQWDNIVRSDIAELQAAGVDTPGFAEALAVLAPPQ